MTVLASPARVPVAVWEDLPEPLPDAFLCPHCSALVRERVGRRCPRCDTLILAEGEWLDLIETPSVEVDAARWWMGDVWISWAEAQRNAVVGL